MKANADTCCSIIRTNDANPVHYFANKGCAQTNTKGGFFGSKM
jgi:hypothetical protein